jgi:glycosyltransferase involved in cell wall biosynthesis
LKVLYFSPSPPPPIQGTDGLFTEIGYLLNSFNGELLSLSPFRSLPPVVPVRLYGIQHLFALKKYEKQIDITHIFFPYLVDFHLLRRLSKPVIFTITSGVEYSYLPDTWPHCTVVVSSNEEADVLTSWGMEAVHIIRPGIDSSRINTTPPPGTDHDFVILMGSAPWVTSQFGKKGFDLMLEVLKKLPYVRLICLWRGRLYREWYQKVHASGLADRIEIINEKVDISGILSRCHVAMVLAEQADLVKSYPNSLMEALVAARPVIVSRAVPMSSYVSYTGCGKVIEKFSADGMVNVINEMRDHYTEFRKVALSVGRRDFSESRMVNEYGRLYQKILD